MLRPESPIVAEDFRITNPGAAIHSLNRNFQATITNKQKLRANRNKVEAYLDASPYVQQINFDQTAKTPRVKSNMKNKNQTPLRQKTLKKRIVRRNSSSSLSWGNDEQKRKLTKKQLKELKADLTKQKYEQEVADIVQQCHTKFTTEIQKDQKKGKRMFNTEANNSSDKYNMYSLPNQDRVRQNLIKSHKDNNADKKQKMMNEIGLQFELNNSQVISQNKNELLGMLSVNDLKGKKKTQIQQLAQNDKVQEYVNHFSHVADYFSVEGANGKHNAAFDFGKLIKQQVESNVKKLTQSETIDKMMKDTDVKRAQLGAQEPKITAFQKAKLRPSIYQHGEEQDKLTLKNVADNFSNKFVQQERMKQRDIEEDFKQVKSTKKEIDPRIKYMKRCLENLNMTLPILDKIYRKTLCLQDYHLSDGNCQGLADACEFLDCKIINRMAFNNCGITGDQLAVILEGVAKMSDFKALIYKMNTINALSIEKMAPLFRKYIPCHMEELQLIDCKMSASLVEQLMDSLINNNARLKKLTLVNASHSDRSFEKVIEFMQNSCFLQDLDLSWSGVRPQLLFKLLQEVSQNRQLRNLSLAHNSILEDQKTELTAQQIEEGQTEVELTDFNLEVVNCFKDFIKYNIHLTHLNLENTGLIEPAIKFIAALLRKSQALQCLHLCGNKGLSTELIAWVKERIHAKAEVPQVLFRAHSAKIRYKGAKRGSPMKRGLMKVFRGASIELQGNDYKTKEWEDIRQGLKLRNIVQSMRMNDNNMLLGSGDSQKLIIQRHLGHKELIPFSAQWGVYTNMKDECWICGHHVMTVFVWTPRVGRLAQTKDPAVITHYKTEIDKLRKSWNYQPYHSQGVPYIMGAFSNYEPIKMNEVIPYTLKNDQNQPDFIKECVQDVTVRQECAATDADRLVMNDEEQKAVLDKKNVHYTEHWHRTLLSIIRYKRPTVANAEAYTLMTLKAQKQPIYFYAEFMKPGKNTYIIEHKQKDDPRSSFYEQTAFKSKITPSEVPPDFYVHQMMSQFRQEDLPFYHNPRHVHRYHTDAQPVKHVFREWKEDQPEIYSQILKHDWDKMLIHRVVEDPQQLTRIKNEIVCNLGMFKEIYNYLQSKSECYPYVSDKVFTNFFIQNLGLGGKRGDVVMHSLNNIVLETCVQGELARKETWKDQSSFNTKYKKLQRCQMIEIMVRFAIYLYSNHHHRSDTFSDAATLDNEYQNLSPSQAFYIFLQRKVKPYFEERDIKWQSFRDDELWVHDIEMVFTLNEVHLRKLFTSYCAKNTAFLKQRDFERMLIEDSTLPITKKMISEAYGMSQQTVINESEESHFAIYSKTTYVEFLEFIARVSVALFADSEMSDETLKYKLEHVLQELFQTMGVKITKNHMKIAEFSDSDDDY